MARDTAFFRKDSKLRAGITDSDGTAYTLPVSYKYLRDMLAPMDEAALAAFTDKMQASNTCAHIRLGLAKPYVHQKGRCCLMCNGVFFS